MGPGQDDDLSLSDFQFSEKGEIVACPQGNAPEKVKKRKRASIGFAMNDCDNCPHLSKCPVKKGKKYYYLRYTDKEMRLAKARRAQISLPAVSVPNQCVLLGGSLRCRISALRGS